MSSACSFYGIKEPRDNIRNCKRRNESKLISIEYVLGATENSFKHLRRRMENGMPFHKPVKIGKFVN